MLTPRRKVLRHWEQVRGARCGVLLLTVFHPAGVTVDCLRQDEILTVSHRPNETTICCSLASDFDPIVLVLKDEQDRLGFAAVTPRVLGDVKDVVENEVGEHELIETSNLSPLPVLSHHKFCQVTAVLVFTVKDSCVDVICDVCMRVSQRCQCSPETRNDHLRRVADRVLQQLLTSNDPMHDDTSACMPLPCEEVKVIERSSDPTMESPAVGPPVLVEAEVEDVTPVRRVYSTKCCNFM